jgi:signal transduction histidine kinase
MWLAAPRRLLILVVVILLLPAVVVVWLGLRLIQQDRELESRQMTERREAAADRAVALLEQALTSTERQLVAFAPAISIRPDDDAVLVTLSSDGISAVPKDHLLYYPAFTTPRAEPDATFEAGERLEYRQQDYAAAAERFRGLAASGDPSTRAGALLRLARNQRRLGQPREALRTYAELANIVDAQVAGLPADLVGRRALCGLFGELGWTADRQREARALRQDLLASRWRLGRGTFLAYAEETSGWSADNQALPKERVALADAVESLVAWSATSGEPGGSGRRVLRVGGVSVVVQWQSTAQRTVALVAGPGFQRREWFAVTENQPDRSAFRLTIEDTADIPVHGPPQLRSAVKRTAAQSGLPWTVLVTDDDSAAAHNEFRDRREMMALTLALVGVVVIVGGVFTARAVSRELAAAQLQSDFVSAVSHEFRTPLTALRQFTDLLNDEIEPPHFKRRTFYQAQARATERLQRLVESLLDFGRMQAGVRPYRFTPIALNDLVGRTVDDFRRDAAPEGFRIDSTFADSPVTVQADSEALTRALWNLLDNAIKYSGESRTVAVRVTAQPDRAAVTVQDRGLGIPRAEQARIFRKFVRGAATLDQQIAGTGIGLAMVRHILTAHGGDVTVESEPGQGSTFALVLPACRGIAVQPQSARPLDCGVAGGERSA